MKTRTRRHLATLVLLLGLTGCSGELVNATGTLTYHGKPVPSTWVIFQPDDPSKRASHGLTDDDGNFKLTYSRTETGVVRGHHTVALKYRLSTEEELHKIPPKASPELRAVIAKYSDPKTSPLHFEINHNGQHLEVRLDDDVTAAKGGR